MKASNSMTSEYYKPAEGKDTIIFREGWIRRGAEGMTTALYGELHNSTGDTLFLKEASCEVAERVELHESYPDSEGRMAMRQIQRMEIPPATAFILKPKAYHIMLIGLTRRLDESDSVEVGFEFEGGIEMKSMVAVKSAR